MKKIIISILVIILIIFVAIGFIRKPFLKDSFTQEFPQREITGTVYVFGNEPFTQLGLKDGERTHCLVGKLEEELWKLQGKTITVYGYGKEENCESGIKLEVFSYTINSS